MKIFTISAIIAILGLLSVVLADNGLEANVQADLTITETCGIQATGGSPIHFGSIETGKISDPQTVDIYNPGSVSSTSLDVYGIDWTGLTPSNTFGVGQTEVNDGSWTALTASPGASIYGGVISNDETKSPQFKVTIPLGQTADTYSQTITFSVECNE